VSLQLKGWPWLWRIEGVGEMADAGGYLDIIPINRGLGTRDEQMQEIELKSKVKGPWNKGYRNSNIVSLRLASTTAKVVQDVESPFREALRGA
jgi:hypothetical protein